MNRFTLRRDFAEARLIILVQKRFRRDASNDWQVGSKTESATRLRLALAGASRAHLENNSLTRQLSHRRSRANQKPSLRCSSTVSAKASERRGPSAPEPRFEIVGFQRTAESMNVNVPHTQQLPPPPTQPPPRGPDADVELRHPLQTLFLFVHVFDSGPAEFQKVTTHRGSGKESSMSP